MNDSRDIWQLVEAKQEPLIALSDRVWATPELCYTEARSAAEHKAELERHGFRITEGVAGIPTAMIGEAGAILGEYDALPGSARNPGSPSTARCRAGATAVAAATICSAPARCLPQSR
jgi:aminobenzoyl-glutamate utilization protein B